MSNAHWFWFCAFSHCMNRKLLIKRFWCYFIKLSEFKQWLVLYRTFWVQVLLKFLISDDEFNKKLVKSNVFMSFCSDSIKISDFKSRFFFRNFWFLSSFLSLSSAVKISEFNFWVELCSLFFYIVYMSITRLISFELMLWICIERIIWVYSN